MGVRDELGDWVAAVGRVPEVAAYNPLEERDDEVRFVLERTGVPPVVWEPLEVVVDRAAHLGEKAALAGRLRLQEPGVFLQQLSAARRGRPVEAAGGDLDGADDELENVVALGLLDRGQGFIAEREREGP